MTTPSATHNPMGAASAYIALGWPVFLLGRTTKRPLALCDDCQRLKDTGTPHDPQGCRCLTCHGFYAATLDLKVFRRMWHTEPNGLLAIRTGAASGLVGVGVGGGFPFLRALLSRTLRLLPRLAGNSANKKRISRPYPRTDVKSWPYS